MAIKSTVKVDINGLVDSLKLLSKQFPAAAMSISTELANDALKAGVNGIIPKRTGDLRSTARVEVDFGKNSVKFITGGKKGESTGNFVNYARYVNYGTSRQKPQFFMERSVISAFTKLDSIANKALKSWLNYL